MTQNYGRGCGVRPSGEFRLGCSCTRELDVDLKGPGCPGLSGCAPPSVDFKRADLITPSQQHYHSTTDMCEVFTNVRRYQ